MIPGSTVNVLVALLLTGLAGSVGHCLGMCGPLVILAGARYPRQGISSAPLHLMYHLGRILVYALMGMAAGALGATVSKIAAAARIPGILSLLVGIAVILTGMSYLGWLPFWKSSIHTGGLWQQAMKRIMKTPGTRGVFMMGVLNGFLPCGLVYEALLVAAASGSLLIGGLGMLIFGAATIPALVVFGVGAQMLSIPVRRTLVWVGGIFVIFVGVNLVVRGAAGLGLFPAMVFAMAGLC